MRKISNDNNKTKIINGGIKRKMKENPLLSICLIFWKERHRWIFRKTKENNQSDLGEDIFSISNWLVFNRWNRKHRKKVAEFY